MSKRNPLFTPLLVTLLLLTTALTALLFSFFIKTSRRSPSPEIDFQLSGENISSAQSSPSSLPPSSPSKNSSPAGSSAAPSVLSSEAVSSDASSAGISSWEVPSLPSLPSNPASTSTVPVSSTDSVSTVLPMFPSSSEETSTEAPETAASSSVSSASSSVSSAVSSTISAETVESYSYRDALSPREQILYDLLLEAMEEYTEFLPAGSYSDAEIEAVYQAIYLEHPELFFLPREYRGSIHSNAVFTFLSDRNGTYFFFTFPAERDEMEARKSALFTQARAVLEQTNGMDTVLEKARFLCDYVRNGQAAELETYFVDLPRERTLLFLFHRMGWAPRCDFFENSAESPSHSLTLTVNGVPHTFSPRG